MSVELLVFMIADGVCAVRASQVREVLRAAALFPLPESPPLVVGGLNLRGEFVPVVDGRAILSRPTKAIEPSDHMIVIGSGRKLVALHVDRALELTVVEENDSAGERRPGTLIESVINTSSGPTAILDVDELLVTCAPLDRPTTAIPSAGGGEP